MQRCILSSEHKDRGLLIMAIIEITKLFIKLFRYVVKECKKMIKEGSF